MWTMEGVMGLQPVSTTKEIREFDTRRFEINDFLEKGDSEAIMDLA